MVSFTCLPDSYLSETHLNELFRDFANAWSAGQSKAALFSSIVNNVRNVYLAALSDTQAEILGRTNDHMKGLTALNQERGDIDRPPTYAPSNATTPHVPHTTPLAPVSADQIQPTVLDPEPTEISWPANTFTLHIGSVCNDYRRDMPDWHPMNRNEWIERLDFQVFRFAEPGTIKLYVVESTTSTYRILVNREPWALEGWKKRLEFHAYAHPRPGTQAVWVGYCGNPDRCIFVKGGRGEQMRGWERRLEFWVPT